MALSFVSIIGPLPQRSFGPVTLGRTRTSVKSVRCSQKRRASVEFKHELTCCASSRSSNERSDIPLFEMRDIRFRVPQDWDRVLFDNLNFKLYRNEFVVMIGPNGAGKSTSKYTSVA